MQVAFVVRNHNGTYLEHHESFDKAEAASITYAMQTGNMAFVEQEEFEDKPDVHLY